MGRLTRSRLVIAAAAAPAVRVVLANLLMLAAAAVGAHPFWRTSDFSLAEAAAQRDAGEVARLLEDGADPNAAYPVRPGLLDNDELLHITAVEAARRARRGEIVRILLDAGAADLPPEPADGER